MEGPDQQVIQTHEKVAAPAFKPVTVPQLPHPPRIGVADIYTQPSTPLHSCDTEEINQVGPLVSRQDELSVSPHRTDPEVAGEVVMFVEVVDGAQTIDGDQTAVVTVQCLKEAEETPLATQQLPNYVLYWAHRPCGQE